MPSNRKLSNRPGQDLSIRNRTLLIALIAGILFAGVLGILSTTNTNTTQTFSNVAIAGSGNAGADLAISGNKDGGFAWGDINQDGFLDLVVNTNSDSLGTRILIANAVDPDNPTYEDKTSTYCAHCASQVKERCAILADLNNDGFIDLVRNTFYGSGGSIDIYLNQGPSGNFALGVGANNDPNKNFSNADFHDNKANTEGMFLADINDYGWLDIVVENHNYGIDILGNPADGTAAFVCLEPANTGLPVSAVDGDYGTCVDFDDDGDVDIIARKRSENDFFVSNGNGTFSDGQDIDDAANGGKGGVVFADFDNDNDYDLFWTDNGINQVWLNNGSNTLSATAYASQDGEPWYSAGIAAPSTGIDGAAVGDVNNDGKVDLFLTANSGSSFLFINNTPDGGSLSFSRDNMGIHVNGNGEGAAFADYDQDGDLDLYVNKKSAVNQLWRNDLNDNGDANYLFVEPRIDLGNGIWRSAIGANVVLTDCDGNIISGIREVPTTSGHGTDAPDRIHFGLAYGPDDSCIVVVKFVNKNGSRIKVEKQITPSQLSNQTLIIYDTDSSFYGVCSDEDQDGTPNWEENFPTLPVEWSSFKAELVDQDAYVSWVTASELNASHFEVERSTDARLFESIGRVNAKGTTQEKSEYSYIDEAYPKANVEQLFYRLKQVDISGTYQYSKVEELRLTGLASRLDLAIYPNPTSENLSVIISHEGMVKVHIVNHSGLTVYLQDIFEPADGQVIKIPVSAWAKGQYYVRLIGEDEQANRTLIVR